MPHVGTSGVWHPDDSNAYDPTGPGPSRGDLGRMATSIAVPLDMLLTSTVGEGTVDATDAVVAGLLGAGAGTNPALDFATADHIGDAGSQVRSALDASYVNRQMSHYQNVAVGQDAMANVQDLKARNNNAFGIGALQHMRRGRYNDAFGLNALHYLDSGLSEPDSTNLATRNSAFGSNTQRFNKTGRNNVSMGRNSLQCNRTGDNNVALGAGAMTTTAPVGINGQIQNQVPQDVSENVAVGTSALEQVQSNGSVGVGYQAGMNAKGHRNTALGYHALRSLDSNLGPDGRVKVDVSWSVTYAISSGTLTITRSNHGLAAGYLVAITFPSWGQQFLHVQSVTTNTFVLNTNLTGVADSTGGANIQWYTTNQAGNNSAQNTAVGNLALERLVGALPGNPASRLNTAVGHQALRFMQDGSDCTEVWGSTGLGQGSSVSGDQQIQLGNQAVTVYAQQAIQTRSDSRDKTDIRDTMIGLDFINRLRPVDFRWDSREDYYVYDDDGNLVDRPTPDGTHARARFHHGLIAQEVKQAMDEAGVEFGGYQDHKVNGGCDVLSIGYDELIGPLVKAVQELSARVETLEGQGN